jgi:hypothetical protein
MSDEIIGTIDIDGPQFRELAGPDKHAINVLHRGHDGQIAFSYFKNERDENGDIVPKFYGFNVNARDLCGAQRIFEEFIEPFLRETAYMTINGIAKAKYRKTSWHHRRFEKYSATDDRVRWLNACWVDLDCGEAMVPQTIATLIHLAMNGTIPPPSILTRSGRGVWAHWLLKDRILGPGHPQRGVTEALSTARRINEHLVNVFRPMKADAHSVNLARIMRVPGSLNTKVNRRTDHWVQLGIDGKPHEYFIDELAAELGVPCTRHPDAVRRIIGTVDPENRKKGIRGSQARWRNEMARFSELMSIRQTIRDGQHGGRHGHAWVLSVILHKNVKAGLCTPVEAKEAIEKFCTRLCSPPLREKEIELAIKYGRDVRDQFSQITIANKLQITPEEAELVGWPPQGTERKPRTTPQKDRTLHRREQIRKIIEARGYVPTIRDISDALADQQMLSESGNPIDPGTIKNDLRVLGIENPRKRRIKPADVQSLLPG